MEEKDDSQRNDASSTGTCGMFLNTVYVQACPTYMPYQLLI